MRYDEARAALTAALSAPLPGAVAQRRLAPMPPAAWPGRAAPTRIRDAAGLLLLFPEWPDRPDQPALTARPAASGPAVPDRPRAHIVLTVRGDTLDRHRGQVSLPGGVVEAGESFEQAALREAHEEIGVRAEDVVPLGALTPVDIRVSGFRLHPIVGAIDYRPRLRPADGEVARVLDVPVEELLDPRALAWKMVERDGLALRVPALVAQGADVWGATAMVLAEFLTLLGWQSPDR